MLRGMYSGTCHCGVIHDTDQYYPHPDSRTRGPQSYPIPAILYGTISSIHSLIRHSSSPRAVSPRIIRSTALCTLGRMLECPTGSFFAPQESDFLLNRARLSQEVLKRVRKIIIYV